MTDNNPVRKDSDTGWDENEYDEANVSYWRDLSEERLGTIKALRDEREAMQKQLEEVTASADLCNENYREKDRAYWGLLDSLDEEVKKRIAAEGRAGRAEAQVDKLIDTLERMHR